MKNNEIMITVRFFDKKDGEEITRDLSFLVLKDKTLREFIEGLYYGLENLKDKPEQECDINLISNKRCFEIFETYLKKYNQLALQYYKKSQYNNNGVITFNRIIYKKIKKLSIIEKQSKKKRKLSNEITNVGKKFKHIFDASLDDLGIVTTTIFLIANFKKEFELLTLFDEKKSDDLEYNISTRMINIVEPSVIEIIPITARPKIDKSIFIDAIITSLLSIVLGVGMRLAMQFLSTKTSSNNIQSAVESTTEIVTTITESVVSTTEAVTTSVPEISTNIASSFGIGMIWMSVGMGFVSAITMTVNNLRKNKKIKRDAENWKKNYERYISNIIKKIVRFQKQDILYLNKRYPQIKNLFQSVNDIDDNIFCRSQNDSDFLSVSLGISEEIEPLFEIKYEKKDTIIEEDEIRYKLMKNESYMGREEESPFNFEIILPNDNKKKEEKKKKKKRKNNGETNEQETENSVNNSNESEYSLISELAYNFANNPPVKETDTDNKKVESSLSKSGFHYLKDYYDPVSTSNYPPLLFELKNCGALGIISNDDIISHRFIRNIVFELSFYHSPENLQFVFFFEKNYNSSQKSEIIKNYKYLPHTNELFENMSQFIFNKESAGEAFSRLFGILNQRQGNKNENGEENSHKQEKYTQIICIFFDDYDIKESGFSRYLPEPPVQGEEYKNELGLTFIFLQDRKGKLPKYCGSTINLNSNSGVLSKRYNVLTREVLPSIKRENKASDAIEEKEFKGDYLFYDEISENNQPVSIAEEFQKAYMQLSSIYYKRIAENGKVPSSVSLFKIWDINSKDVKELKLTKESPIVKKIKALWDSSDITKGLDVPIGENEHGIAILDMHQDGDGPHGLVAGTTGSGKSETLITYVIGCCMKFKPEELNFMLIDMKGGGFSDRLGGLPHLVGAVTNTTGEEEGISSEYMLRRFLATLNSEIKKRELILKRLDVDNIDDYINIRKEIMKYRKLVAEDREKGNPENVYEKLKEKFLNKTNRYEACNPDKEEPEPLAHLLLIVDEFTELKRFSNDSNDIDFIKDITTIARVGRTLGFHIILVSQNIEGAITEDIRVNSKARICLKVATKSASKDMIGTTDAAAATMPGHGRAYLLVGTGSRYEYFQSAYTAANRNMSIKEKVKLTHVTDSGKYDTDFYSSDDNKRMKVQNRPVNKDDTQLNYIINAIKIIAGDYEKSTPLFLEPLKSKEEDVVDDTDWVWI